MKKLHTISALLLILLTSFAVAQQKPTKVIGAGLTAAAKAPFNITAGKSVTLSRDTVYILTGFYYVDSTASLYIQPGTVILGDSATNGTVIVRRGGKIFAEGTRTEPIVFTSSKQTGKRKRGDWGGIVILGNAPTNKPTTTKIEGIDVGGEYGGTDANDNSGVIRYVRIEYPGVVISLNNEINGLTMGGVGKGTKIEYVQVTNSNDDSFEWFGGTVDAKHLIAINGTDDDFDTDFGYSGRIQFAFSKRDANLWDGSGQSNGFESDNDATPTTQSPLTNPIFSNVTLVGPQTDTSVALPAGQKFEYGAVIRRNTRLSFHNSIIMGFPFGLSLRNDSTAAYALQGNLQIRNVSLQARTNVLNTASVAAGVGFTFATWYGTAGWNNLGASPRQPSAIGLVDVFASVPDARPTLASEAATAGTDYSSNQLNDGWFSSVSFRGAFDPKAPRSQQWDWGWSNYDPQNTNYGGTVRPIISQRPTKVIGAGLTAAAKSPFNLTSGKSITLYRDTAYVLTGFYYVDSLATINIQAGAVILGDSATNGTLIIRRGGSIFAEGTKNEPIVFTSSKEPGKRKRGDWGGVVILGNAPTNKPVTTKIEGIDVGGEYGGDNPNDNSGVFRYVRIEFPGVVISLNNEINGLTMGGVGKATKIEYVQVSNSNDDSFEWFGGTVDAKYLVALNGTDDDFDTDFGYSGNVQFAFGKRDGNLWDANGQSNGFESDNDATPTTQAPLTAPVFSNITLVGPQSDTTVALPAGQKFEYGAVIRRNTRLSVHNTIILGYPFGLSIRNDSTASYAQQGLLQLRNISLQARTNVLNTASVAAGLNFNFGTFFGTSGWNNLSSSARQPSAIALVDAFNVDPTKIDPRPTTGSEAVTAGTSYSSTQVAKPFFTQVSYRGAFDPATPRNAQWDAGWTNYNPNSVNYITSVKVKSGINAPAVYSLDQNYPNPFNPSTTINYVLPMSGNVTLKVYNLIGQEVATLVNDYQQAGGYNVKFDASKLSSGVYFYSLNAGNYTQVKKMMLLK
ncbi:MAG: T9SS type A sorting domain-containing protein [Bacteroidota bacterium]